MDGGARGEEEVDVVSPLNIVESRDRLERGGRRGRRKDNGERAELSDGAGEEGLL